MKKLEILLASKSEVKLNAIKQLLEDEFHFKDFNLIGVSVEAVNLPSQPVNTGMSCCQKRTDYVQNQMINGAYDEILPSGVDIIIGIENGIEENKEKCEDICYVHMNTTYGTFSNRSFTIPFDRKYYVQAKEKSERKGKIFGGLNVSVGEILSREFSIPHNNWSSDPRFGGRDRYEQIKDAMRPIIHEYFLKSDNHPKVVF